MLKRFLMNDVNLIDELRQRNLISHITNEKFEQI